MERKKIEPFLYLERWLQADQLISPSFCCYVDFWWSSSNTPPTSHWNFDQVSAIETTINPACGPSLCLNPWGNFAVLLSHNPLLFSSEVVPTTVVFYVKLKFYEAHNFFQLQSKTEMPAANNRLPECSVRIIMNAFFVLNASSMTQYLIRRICRKE